ncbi:MAG: cyclodeaminase/cyclohydrolase family protein [Bacillota bacterium]|nr:cyclodeaminase/cyclohydrolase family protein [Bacillota bacterium]
MELIEKKVMDLLDDFASETPAPGGGSASALSASMGAALVCMVGKLTVGKKKFLLLPDADRSHFIGAVASFEPLRIKLALLVDEDAKSFDGVMAGYRMPKTTEAEAASRTQAIETALRGAIAIPMKTAELAAAGIAKLDGILAHANKSCLSDLGSAAMLLSAGLAGATMNVEINLGGLSDETEKQGYRDQLAAFTALRSEAERIVSAIRGS